MKHDLDSYPTICGFCGKALVEDKDSMMNCDCPKFTEMVKSGLTEDPEAYKGWTKVKKC